MENEPKQKGENEMETGFIGIYRDHHAGAANLSRVLGYSTYTTFM